MTQSPSTEEFLLAAKQSEINALQQLMVSCGLVIKASELIHALQKERGLSNSYLVSAGKHLSDERLIEIHQTDLAQQAFTTALAELDLERCGSSTIRLYNSIAFVLHQLDALADFRAQVTQRNVNALAATKFFNHLVAGLLAVIFEAADVSNDPDITRALVALFNFVQGKEYAGQERAWGVFGFTAGEFDNATREKIKALQEAQERCFSIFNDFSKAIFNAQLRQLEDAEAAQEMAKMRQLIERFQTGDSIPTAIGEVWYQAATVRIDGMQDIAQQMAQSLSELCQNKVNQALEELDLHKKQLVSLTRYEAPPMSALTALEENKTDTSVHISSGINVQLAHSLYDLVQKQAEHLRQVSDELTIAKRTLNERKVIEKAKGILMTSQNVSEEAAYKQLRQAAMDGNRRIIDIAENIISVTSLLNAQPI